MVCRLGLDVGRGQVREEQTRRFGLVRGDPAGFVEDAIRVIASECAVSREDKDRGQRRSAALSTFIRIAPSSKAEVT